MNQFGIDNTIFIFNNKNISELYGWYILTLEKDSDSSFGLNRTFNYDSFGNKNAFTGFSYSRNTLSVTLVRAEKINGDFVAKPVTKKDIFILNKQLFFNEPKAIIYDHKLYYGFFKDGTLTKKHENGIITIKFEMSDNYIYSFPIKNKYTITDNLLLNIFNDTDINSEGKIKLDIKIKPYYEKNTNIIIKNNTTKETMNLNLKTTNEIVIYGESLQVLDLNDPNNIIYSNEFISLESGNNKIEILTNNKTKIELIYQKKYGIK